MRCPWCWNLCGYQSSYKLINTVHSQTGRGSVNEHWPLFSHHTAEQNGLIVTIFTFTSAQTFLLSLAAIIVSVCLCVSLCVSACVCVCVRWRRWQRFYFIDGIVHKYLKALSTWHPTKWGNSGLLWLAFLLAQYNMAVCFKRFCSAVALWMSFVMGNVSAGQRSINISDC